MKERPLLFSGVMVRALRQDRKTQTRRLAQPRWVPGDRLWTKENYRLDCAYDNMKASEVDARAGIRYEADRARQGFIMEGKLRPSIFLRRVWSRDLLEVVDVRHEPLLDITEQDCLAEGIVRRNVIVGADNAGGRHREITANRYFFEGGDDDGYEDGRDAYFALWDSLNGFGAADENPLVWATTFRRLPVGA